MQTLIRLDLEELGGSVADYDGNPPCYIMNPNSMEGSVVPVSAMSQSS